MAPVSLNPAGPSIQLAGQNYLFTNSPNNQDPTSLSCPRPTLFSILDPSGIGDFGDNNDQQADKVVLHDGSSSRSHQIWNSSFNIAPKLDDHMDDPSSRITRDPNLCIYNKMKEEEELEESKSGHGSPKWMSSKMRLMKKMMRPSSSSSSSSSTTTTPVTATATDKAAINTNTATATATPPRIFQNENRHSQRTASNNNTNDRVCADCNTSTTPLWRSGPKGPKSLCNACGIRQRKARIAMAEAANYGLATPTEASSSSTKIRVHSKEKKSRTNHFAQFKNKCKSTAAAAAAATGSFAAGEGISQGERKKLEFKDFAISFRGNTNSGFQQMFPEDEVAEAAVLLMHLSCGFIHHF